MDLCSCRYHPCAAIKKKLWLHKLQMNRQPCPLLRSSFTKNVYVIKSGHSLWCLTGEDACWLVVHICALILRELWLHGNPQVHVPCFHAPTVQGDFQGMHRQAEEPSWVCMGVSWIEREQYKTWAVGLGCGTWSHCPIGSGSRSPRNGRGQWPWWCLFLLISQINYAATHPAQLIPQQMQCLFVTYPSVRWDKVRSLAGVVQACDLIES